MSRATTAAADPELVRLFDQWREYERTHDLSAHKGHTAAIDRETGEVHFGIHMTATVEAAGDRGRHLIFIRFGRLDVERRRHRLGGRWRRVT